MLKIRRRKHKINIISLSLVITLLSSFFTYNNVLAKEIDNNKKDISCSKKDSMWSKAKKYLLTGVAVTGAGFLIKKLNVINKDKISINEEVELDLPQVYLLGTVSKKPILESLGLIDENYMFEEKYMPNFKMTGKCNGTDKKVNVVSMPSEGAVELVSIFMLRSIDALNIISINLDANINEIEKEIDNWVDMISNSDISTKRTIFVCLYSGKNADVDKANRIKDIAYKYTYSLEFCAQTPLLFLISKDKNCEEGKNLKDNILRLT